MIYPEYKIDRYVYFDTFTFQEKTYYLNSIVKLKNNKKLNIAFVQLVMTGIDAYGKRFWTYAFWDYYGNVSYKRFLKSPDEIVECVLEASSNPPIKQEIEYYKDCELSIVMIGWFIYVILMIGGCIFRDRVVWFVFCSIFFFVWRRIKLKKQIEHDYGFDDFYKKVGELSEWQT